jgi:hypothetical protein
MSMIPSFDDFDEPAFVPHDILFPEDTDASSDSTPPEPDAIGISKEELVDKLLPAFLSMVRATSQVVLRVTQKRLDREAAERES